nr:uncharacterized protein LOC112785916 [Arachis hypogaea]
MATIAEALSCLTLPPSTITKTLPNHQPLVAYPLNLNHPKGSINIITLRSGTTLVEIDPKPTIMMEDVHDEELDEAVEMNEDENEDVAMGEEEQLKSKEPKRKSPLEELTPIPFSIMAKKAKKHEELDPNMVQIFKKVEVTIQLFDTIQQVPKYTKFLKDMCTHKEKISELGMHLLGSSISSVMGGILEKYNDPGPCLVSCMIGGMRIMDCMCDLGSCVSIMPLSAYERLNLAPLKWFRTRFVLADKSVILVLGIAENVLVSIQDLIFPVDHILETSSIDSERPSSILLGKPFLKAAQLKLDAFFEAYSFKAEGKVVRFNLD